MAIAIRADVGLPRDELERYSQLEPTFGASMATDSQAARRFLAAGQAMLARRPEALDALDDFKRVGRLDIGATTVERQGAVGYLYHGNPRYLNAEDDSTTSTLEIGTDLLLLDPSIDVCVMRGKVVEHAKYAGRRIFNAGINLTH